MKIDRKKLLVLCIISAAVFVAVLFLRGVTGAQGARDVLRCASDAAFVAGTIMLVTGGLMWTADQGVADGLTYGVGRFFKRRGVNYEDRRESYSEYKERKHSKKIKVAEFFISGAIFVVIALILLIPYSFV